MKSLMIATMVAALLWSIASMVISLRQRRESKLNTRLCRLIAIERDRFHRRVTLPVKKIKIEGSPYKLSNAEVTIG